MNIGIGSNRKCEKCSTLIIKEYGSGRFCNPTCARSFSSNVNRAETNKKVSKALKGKSKNLSPAWLKANREWGKKWSKIQQDRKLSRYVKVGGDTLDITYRELKEYRLKHLSCEMCGVEAETKKNNMYKNLTIDHCHKTKKFRGLLCVSCNRFLGYYENSKHLAEKYLYRTLV